MAGVQPLGLVGGLGWQRLQSAQRRRVGDGDRRVGLQQRAIMIQKRLFIRGSS